MLSVNNKPGYNVTMFEYPRYSICKSIAGECIEIARVNDIGIAIIVYSAIMRQDGYDSVYVYDGDYCLW